MIHLSALSNTIRYLDFKALVLINKEVVALTGDRHEYDEEDERRMKSMLRSVEEADIRGSLADALVAKAAMLVFKIASGQNFHEGNKRTALVAGLAFMNMNGLTLDLEDKDLVSVVDKAGVSSATLKDVEAVVRRLARHV